MSWQEKINQRLEELKRTEAQKIEIEEKKKAEQIKLGNEALERLRCEEKLSQIRDEVWQMGEIIPGTPKYLHYYEKEAQGKGTQYPGIVLRASWPRLQYHSREFPEIGFDTIAREEESLAINIQFDEEDNLYLQIYTYKLAKIKVTNNPQAEEELEESLLQDCIYRGRFLKSKREENEAAVIEEIIEEGTKPPKEFEYILDLAEKVQQESRKT